MRFAPIGTLALVLLPSACGPDWDALLGARALQPEDAGDSVVSVERPNAATEDERLIRGSTDASAERDAGNDAGVFIEQAR
jgi:hypothetical protein